MRCGRFEAGRGVLVYLRGHEGRGIGTTRELTAYNLQDEGHDTVDANLQLGLPVDAREYGIAAQILLELGIERVRLITNNLASVAVWRASAWRSPSGSRCGRVQPSTTWPTWRRKRRRMGHLLEDIEIAGAVETAAH